MIYQHDFKTKEAAKQAVFEYIEICGAARAVQSATEAFIVGVCFPF